MNPQKSNTEIIKQVKGSSSHWVNEQDLTNEKFSWQTGYAAYSVTESVLEKVYHYINNQKQQHKERPFLKEYAELIRLHGLQPG